MKPYWSNEQHGLSIYHGDCLEVMPGLGREFDLCLTDPPYGMTDLALDTVPENWGRDVRGAVCSGGHLCAFGCLPTLAPLLAWWQYRFGGIWLKPNGGPRSHNAKLPKSQHEWFAVFAHKSTRPADLKFNQQYIDGEPFVKVQRNSGFRRGQEDSIDRVDPRGFTQDGYRQVNHGTRCVTDVLQGPSKPYMQNDERTQHPTQKPVEVLVTQVTWLTDTGDTVIDPFLGSGTTLVACYGLGRQGVGIEISEEYCELAARRLEREIAQGRLFEPAETAPKAVQTTLEVDA